MTTPAPTAIIAALRALAFASEIAASHPASRPIVTAALGAHGGATVSFSFYGAADIQDPCALFAALPHDPSAIEHSVSESGETVAYEWTRRDGLRVSVRIASDLDATFRRRARAEAGVTLPGGLESGPEPARDETPVKSRSVA